MVCSFISNEARITKVSARVDLGVVCADDLTPTPQEEHVQVSILLSSVPGMSQTGRSQLASSFPGASLLVWMCRKPGWFIRQPVTNGSLIMCLESEEDWNHFHESQDLTTWSPADATKLLR